MSQIFWPLVLDVCRHEIDRIRRRVCIHCERQVHAKKRNINILEGAHFWHVLRIIQDVDASTINGQNVAIVVAFWLKVKPIFGQVVGCDRLDGDVTEHRIFAIYDFDNLNLDGIGKCVVDVWIGDQHSAFHCHRIKRLLVKVVAMFMCDQDQIYGRKIGIRSRITTGSTQMTPPGVFITKESWAIGYISIAPFALGKMLAAWPSARAANNWAISVLAAAVVIRN
jgi:hypothetical protein